ncbi:hypothetical protein OS493_001335 [Desmophyllum pertusum]|uniref:Uncharacterized protein n=1 Tax=Desmophyllum pertusum TaxID=174260 RepID=A0A9W9ZJP3_9CNID|nr:hypothetical protein OS493_001335 [Desmophyllum pertusum]
MANAVKKSIGDAGFDEIFCRTVVTDQRDPVDNKKVSRTQKAATKKLCLKKTRQQQEERRSQPPGSPKPALGNQQKVKYCPNFGAVDGGSWTMLTTSIWILEPDGFFLKGGVTQTSQAANSVSSNVKQAGHPRRCAGEDKDWICRGDENAFHSLDGLRTHINATHLPKRFSYSKQNIEVENKETDKQNFEC